jgi:hypothetical protein
MVPFTLFRNRLKAKSLPPSDTNLSGDQPTYATESGFSYQPLTGPKDIRLLVFDPSLDPQPPVLTFKLINVPLEQVYEKYLALSYVWGENKNKRRIRVNGKDFDVTPNLEVALRNVWAKQFTTCIWVDAICINQSSNLEKNSQIRLMGEIYLSSFIVLIWLGEATPQSALAIAHLDQNISHKDGSMTIDLDYPVNDPRYADAWDAMGQDLLKRPWWRRAWVTQEVALANRSTVLCGQDVLAFEKLAFGTMIAFNHDLNVFYGSEDGFTNNWNVTRKQEYRLKRVRGQDMPLHELLANNISSSATDPRDIIYSLLGLATDVKDAAELIPDYDATVEQLYTNLVKFHVRKYNTIDLICVSRNPKKHDKLPSWVPDWSNLKETMSESLIRLTSTTDANRYDFHASKSRPLKNDVFASGENVLHVSGVLVDKIAHTGANGFMEASQGPEIFKDWSDLAEEKLGMRNGYVTKECRVFEAYNRTLCCDLARSGQRAIKGQRAFEVYSKGVVIPDSFRQGITTFSDPEEKRRLWIQDAMQAVLLRAPRRRLFITEKGYMGLGPSDAEKGDTVAVILGCNVPVIIREKESKWNFVGESYVCGIMDGEIMDLADAGDYEIDNISLL